VDAGTAIGETDIPTIVAVVLGALTAGSIHGRRATVRPAATTTTAGFGNPVLSLGEDAASGLLTLAAFALPVLALLLVLALPSGSSSASDSCGRGTAAPAAVERRSGALDSHPQTVEDCAPLRLLGLRLREWR
jgi:hypothetical protein